jgi:hypothetical protein
MLNRFIRWLRREMFGTFDGTEEEFWDRQW